MAGALTRFAEDCDMVHQARRAVQNLAFNHRQNQRRLIEAGVGYMLHLNL